MVKLHAVTPQREAPADSRARRGARRRLLTVSVRAGFEAAAASAAVALAALTLLVGAAGPAGASSSHHSSGLSPRQIIEIAVACVVALILASISVTLLRRHRTKRLARESSAMPFSPQAVLGRLPPGRDIYGNDLYAAQVVGSGASETARAARPATVPSGAASRPAHQMQWAGRAADANMLSYELERLAVLRDAGTISDKEYGEARRRLLG